VAYDRTIAQRFRDGLHGVKVITEKRMMGGLCLLVNGNMLGGVDQAKSGRDRLMFHVGKDNEAKALRRPGVSIVNMGGKRLGGLVFVDADACDQAALKEWIAMALGFARRLPKK
jgi:TfoX/Sxy family transcriptional regulator of competence genes